MTLAGIALVVAGCGSTTDTPVTPATPAITLSANTAAVTVTVGGNTTASLTISRSGGFTGDVALSASGAPTGVTVTFNPTGIGAAATSSSATIAVGATAVAGTNTVTITASGAGVTSKTVTIAITVPAAVTPAITLSAGTSTLSVVAGTAGTVPLTISRTGGFTGDVTLAATGLPAGVTASFAPATLTAAVTSSTMTLTAAASAVSPATTVTVTASGTGVTAQTATVSLTVTAASAPDFALTATPASLSITVGQAGTSTVTLTRTGGFAGNVTLALEGAPAGVTAAFAPNPATAATSTLTITTAASAIPGTYNLTVRGTATGQSDRTTTIALTVAPLPGISLLVAPTLSATAGTVASTSITIVRIGSFTGDVALTLENAPAGVTAAFTPPTITSTGTTSSLALTVPANQSPATTTMTVRATGTGITAQTAVVAFTVAAAQGYSLAATSVSTAQGTTGTSTITINRTGGFAGSVSLAVAGLPSGVTATFTPQATTGNTSSLALSVAASVAPGTYSAGVFVTGTATALTTVTTPLTLTVTQAGGGGGAIVGWRFCDAANVPLWFAFRDGTGGTWTRVIPSANNTFSFSLSQSVGGVALVQNFGGTSTQVTVYYQAASELNSIASQECLANPTTKTVFGSVANVAAGQTGSVSAGNATASVAGPATAFTLNNLDDGLIDLVATRASLNTTTFAQVPDKMILRRSFNPAANSTMAVLDFNGSEAFAPGSAVYTIANGGTDQLFAISSFLTANGSNGSFSFFEPLATGNTRTIWGVPSTRTQAGDLHFVIAQASNATGSISRGFFQYNRDLANRTLTLGALLNVPAVTSIGTAAFARLKTAGTFQSDYLDGVTSTFNQSTRGWSVQLTKAYLGNSASFDFDVPDLSGVSGFQSTWALVGGVSTQWSVSALGGLANFVLTEGTTLRTATRTGTITP